MHAINPEQAPAMEEVSQASVGGSVMDLPNLAGRLDTSSGMVTMSSAIRMDEGHAHISTEDAEEDETIAGNDPAADGSLGQALNEQSQNEQPQNDVATSA